MALNTNLPLPIFNVLKYMFLSLAIDGVVRSGLDSFEHFRRRLFLYRGHAVQVGTGRIDRYNLLHRIHFRHVSSLLLFLTTLAAYAVEIGLEFATNSKVARFPIAGEVKRLNYTHGVCTLDAILYQENANRFARLAEKCIAFENGMYRLYRPIWISGAHNTPEPLCERTPENVLDESEEVYESLEGKGEQAKREIEELLRIMRVHSYKSNGDASRAVISMHITSKDVIGKFVHEDDDAVPVTSAAFIKTLAKSAVKCFGTVHGRQGEGMMRLAMLACTNGFTENSTMCYAEGTGLVEMDIEDMHKEWSTIIAIERRRSVYRFANKVVNKRLHNNAVAYAVFLAESRAQDRINVNKYAIAYRNCEQLSVPSRKAESWIERVPISNSELRNTATIEVWGITLVVSWVAAVTVARTVLHWAADRKGMPNKVLGEQQILCLWIEEKQRNKLRWEANDGVERCNTGYLSVEHGDLHDSITATRHAKDKA